MNKHNICVAYGDGIGPEIMEATLQILSAAKAPLKPETILIGESVYRAGYSSGITPEAWDLIKKNKVLLKSPITTPQGGGYKSLNVSLRKTLGLYANVRPCKAYSPFIHTYFPKLDLVIIRENEEDLYAGIEHRQTQQVIQCLKLISVPGCERILQYAFEYARHHGRKKITCMSKDNIMKMTDGLFHKMFTEMAKKYPDIKTEHLIIDIGAALIATQPEQFDVIVTLNLYGDILSDIAAQVAGSVGLAGSANIGKNCAMFEAIHGSAPDIAGKNLANPSGLIHAAIQMLEYLGEIRIAQNISQAWFNTIADGIHTKDIYQLEKSKQLVSTSEFATAVTDRLKSSASSTSLPQEKIKLDTSLPSEFNIRLEKKLIGVDVFLDYLEKDTEKLASKLKQIAGSDFDLILITNRGAKVWPDPCEETLCTDHWRCRFKFLTKNNDPQKITELLNRIQSHKLQWIKVENLYFFDDEPGFSLGQGE